MLFFSLFFYIAIREHWSFPSSFPQFHHVYLNKWMAFRFCSKSSSIIFSCNSFYQFVVTTFIIFILFVFYSTVDILYDIILNYYHYGVYIFSSFTYWAFIIFYHIGYFQNYHIFMFVSTNNTINVIVVSLIFLWSFCLESEFYLFYPHIVKIVMPSIDYHHFIGFQFCL